MAFARSLMICLVGLAAARKLPHHKATEHFHQGAPRPACAQPLVVRHSSSGRSSSGTSPALADCWVPDYCEPEKFQYKLCRLRLRGRAKPGNQYACAEDEYCEEVTRGPPQPSASASAPPPSQPPLSSSQLFPQPAVWQLRTLLPTLARSIARTSAGCQRTALAMKKGLTSAGWCASSETNHADIPTTIGTTATAT